MSRRILPSPVRYALFDFDGVVSDTSPLYFELDRRTLERFGYAPTDGELRSFIGHSSEVMGPRLLAEHGIEVTTAEWLGVWDADKEIYGSPALEPSPGLAELWGWLRGCGAKIAVVSTTPCVSLVRALNHFQLLSCVDAIVGREMAARQKPDPDPYLVALRLLAPEDADAAAHAVAVDDSRAGVAAALASGAYTVCYCGASERQEGVEADCSVASFVELLGILRASSSE